MSLQHSSRSPGHSSRGNSSLGLLVVVVLAVTFGVLALFWLGLDRSAPMPGPVGSSGAGSAPGASVEPGEALDAAIEPSGAEPTVTREARDVVSTPDRSEAGASDAEDAKPGVPLTTLRGVVFDERGTPLEGARVGRTASPPPGLDALPISISGFDSSRRIQGSSVRTDAEGRFEFTLPLTEPETIDLVAEHPGRPSAVTSVALKEVPTTREGLRISLRAGAAISGLLRGIPEGIYPVSSISGGGDDAVEGAEALFVLVQRVRESAMGGSLLSVDLGGLVGLAPGLSGEPATLGPIENGQCTFVAEGLDPGTDYEVFAIAGRWGLVEVADVEEREATGEAFDEFELTSVQTMRLCTDRVTVRTPVQGVDLVFRQSGQLVAQFVDASTGEPVVGVEASSGRPGGMSVFGMDIPVVALQRRPETSAANGVLVLPVSPDPEDKPLTVQFTAAGYRPVKRAELQVQGGARIDLGTIRLERAPILEVLVIDAATGEPIAGASVRVDDSEVDGDPDEDGEDSQQVSMSFSLGSGGNEGVDDDDLVIGPDAMGLERRTDERGIAELTWTRDGPGALEVSADGYAMHVETDFAFPDGPYTVQMQRGGTLELTLLEADGTPLVGGTVERRGPDAGRDLESDDQESNAQGLLILENLPVGTHSVRLDGSPGTTETMRFSFDMEGLPVDDESWLQLEVVEGETTRATLQAPLLVTVFGSVRLGDELLERATVRFVPGKGGEEAGEAIAVGLLSSFDGFSEMVGESPIKCQTGASGDFELEGVPLGEHRLWVRHADLSVPFMQPVTVVDGSNVVAIVLPDTTLEGRVVDDSGAPASGVQISAAPLPRDARDGEEFVDGFGDIQGALSDVFGGLLGSGGSRDAIKTDRDGVFRLRGLRPGQRYRIVTRARWFERAALTVGPFAQGASPPVVQLTVPRAGRVSVRSGAVENVFEAKAVWIGDGEAPRNGQALIRNGSATIDSLKPGRWRIELHGTGSEPLATQEVVVEVRTTARAEF